MNQSERMDRNERLGAALRRGDPASEETGLSPAEIQAMRRAVLTKALETGPETARRSYRLAPVFAAGAVAVLSLVVTLSLWRMRGPEPVTPVLPAPAPVGAEPSVPPAFQSPAAVAVAVPPPPAHGVRRRERARRPLVAEEPAAGPARPPETGLEPEEAPLRQVQFSTAGGTRIIWLLPETKFQGAR
jgi:hypothetical protein